MRSTNKTISLLASTITQQLKWETSIDWLNHQNGPGENVLDELARWAAHAVLHSNHRVCSPRISHSLVWTGYQTGWGQSATNWEDHCCWPAYNPGLIHLQSQRKSLHHNLDLHCSISPHCTCQNSQTRTMTSHRVRKQSLCNNIYRINSITSRLTYTKRNSSWSLWI